MKNFERRAASFVEDGPGSSWLRSARDLASAEILIPSAGLGFFLLWSYLKLIATFESSAGEVVGQILVLASLGFEVLFFVVAIAAFRSKVLQPDLRLLVVAAVMAAVGGSIRYFAAVRYPSIALASIGSVLVAGGFAYMTTQWGHFFKNVEPGKTSVMVIAAFVFAAAMLSFSGLFLNFPGKMLLLSLSPLAAAALFWHAYTRCKKANRPAELFQASFSSKFSFFAAGGVTALMLGHEFFSPSPQAWLFLSAVALAAFVCLLVVLPLFAAGRIGVLHLCQASFALMLFGYLGVVYVGGGLPIPSTSVAIIGFLLIDLLAWCIPAEGAYRNQEGAIEIMAKTRLLVNGGSLMGMVLLFLADQVPDLPSIGGFGLDGLTALSVVALFSASLFLGGFVPPSVEGDGRSNGAEGSTAAVSFRSEQSVADGLETQRQMLLEVCRIIGNKGGLSQREREVFHLLAQGRSRAFIQEELCISKGTANTHISSIYRKLDVHGQQELLSLFHEEVRKLNEATRG